MGELWEIKEIREFKEPKSVIGTTALVGIHHLFPNGHTESVSDLQYMFDSIIQRTMGLVCTVSLDYWMDIVVNSNENIGTSFLMGNIYLKPSSEEQ